MRDELLNETLFVGLDHARQVIGSWAYDYNTASRILRSATRHLRPIPLISPSSAARLLFTPRRKAYQLPRL
jgi:hypothetical protein